MNVNDIRNQLNQSTTLAEIDKALDAALSLLTDDAPEAVKQLIDDCEAAWNAASGFNPDSAPAVTGINA